MTLNFFTFAGQKLAYIDQGSGPVVVFVHGTPSSSAEFFEVIQGLSQSYRCIAIDHLGFGKSEKPQNGDYRLSSHTYRLRTLLEDLGVDQYHLVVHDFGGAIGLPLALEGGDKVLSLTLINTWAWPLVDTEPNLKKQRWLMQSSFMRFLYRYLNFSPRVMVKAAWGTYRPLTREKHRHYMDAFPTFRDREGPIACLEALFDPMEFGWLLYLGLKEVPPKKVQIFWGGRDVISTRTMDRWKEIFPHAKVCLFENVGHFVCDEASDLVIPALKNHLI